MGGCHLIDALKRLEKKCLAVASNEYANYMITKGGWEEELDLEKRTASKSRALKRAIRKDAYEDFQKDKWRNYATS